MGDDPKTKSKADEDAKRRARIVMEVRCGMKSVAEACRELDVSRKTYYKWEGRILDAMLESARDGNPGRPGQPESDLRKTELERRNAELIKEVEFLNKKIELKNLALQLSPEDRGWVGSRPKKTRG